MGGPHLSEWEFEAPVGGAKAMRRMSRERVNSPLIFAVLCALLLSFIPLAASAQSTGSSLLVKLVDGLSPALQADVIARNGGVERSVIPAPRLPGIDRLPGELKAGRANHKADPPAVRRAGKPTPGSG